MGSVALGFRPDRWRFSDTTIRRHRRVLRNLRLRRSFAGLDLPASVLLFLLVPDDPDSGQSMSSTARKEPGGRIVYLDEVLTMSARMAAATGDLSWEKRYNEHLPLLLKAIDQALAILPDFQGLKQTESANAELDRLEREAFQQVHAGHPEAARDLLFGAEYVHKKEIYAQGMQALGQQLQGAAEATTRVQQRRALLNVVVAVGAIPPLIIGWLIVLRVLRRWRQELLTNHQHLRELNRDLGR